MNILQRFLVTLFALTSTLVVGSVSITHAATTLDTNQYVIFYHSDLVGSPAVVTDHNGNTLWHEHSDPYGRARARVTETRKVLDHDRVGSRKGYTGHLKDEGSNLVYMKARFYDPQIGRFYSNDPMVFTEANPMMFNRYAYANNNPYRYVDPDGRDARDIQIIQQHIAKNFPELRQNISVEYSDIGQVNGRAARIANKIYLPEYVKTEKLDASTFGQRYETVLHESMHVTDNFLGSWGKSIVEYWSALFSGKDTETLPHHQSIYNRVDYELNDVNSGPPTKPVWYNGTPPENPVGVDTDQLFEETRETEE